MYKIIQKSVRFVFTTAWQATYILGVAWLLGLCAAVVYHGFLWGSP